MSQLINIITDKDNKPIYFFKATELIQKLGLGQSLNNILCGSQLRDNY